MRLAALLLVCVTIASAQLIPTGSPVPRRTNPPAVFLNGYQLDCSTSGFAPTFANADKILQTSQIATLYFDNCTVPGKPSIEALGLAFGKFLSGLKYDDGTPVTQVDVVAHSMGGLIVRSYLAGKQDTPTATFAPPASGTIRKAIFLAAPNWGIALDLSKLVDDTEVKEITLGSSFLFDLGTWNQGTDDLRGVDALQIAGNAGIAFATPTKGFDDGLVSLTSSSVAFAEPGKTRIVPYCHSSDPLLTQLGLCTANSPAIAQMKDGNGDVARLVVSFLTGTNDWKSIGTAAEQDPLASTNAGVNLMARTLDDQAVQLSGASYSVPGASGSLSVNDNKLVAFKEALPPNVDVTLQPTPVSGAAVSATAKLVADTVTAVIAKPGPRIIRAFPAASRVFPLSVAPGAFIAIYGANLSGATMQAGALPYPTKLGDVEVQVNGSDVPVQFASAGQINAVVPDLGPGLVQLTVVNAQGKHSVNLLIDQAVPSVFTQDASGTGAASALNAITSALVTANAPLHSGDYVSLYLTGLGRTARQNGLDYAQATPTVTVGGQACKVTYAGRAPGYAGLDQINCQIPAGVAGAALPVAVVQAGRAANAVTLSVQ